MATFVSGDEVTKILVHLVHFVSQLPALQRRGIIYRIHKPPISNQKLLFGDTPEPKKEVLIHRKPKSRQSCHLAMGNAIKVKTPVLAGPAWIYTANHRWW
jgi:hypothetical protein